MQSYGFLSFSGATMLYHGEVSHVPWSALPSWHANLLHNHGVVQDIERLLTTGKLTTHRVSTAAFRAIWGAALPLQMRAGWDAPPDTDPAFAGWHCYSR